MKKQINLVTLAITLCILTAIMAVPTVIAGSVNASNITLLRPASNSVIYSKTYVLNASIIENVENYTLAYYYAKSASTANSSWSLIATQKNDTLYAFNTTFSTLVLEDSNDYEFNVTLFNGSNRYSVVNTGITIDNGVPTAPSSCEPTDGSTTNSNDVTFNCTVVGRNTTGCTLYFTDLIPASSSYTMTHAGNACWYALTGIPEQSYKWYVSATDNSNSTSGSSQTATFDVKSSAGKAAVLASQQNLRPTGGATFSVVGESTSTLGDVFNGKVLGIPTWLVAILVIVVIVGVAKYRK